MAIEDVDYLIANSEKDSATFFIDSSRRDKAAYHDPQEFTLEFTEPLRNVYGVEILDATIPVTMYNVDDFNDAFAYTRVLYRPGFNVADFRACFAELQDNADFNRVFDGAFASNVFVYTDAAAYAATLADAPAHAADLVFSPHVAVLRRVLAAGADSVRRELDASAPLGADRVAFEYRGLRYSLAAACGEEAVRAVRRGADFSVVPSASGAALSVVAYDRAFLSAALAAQLVDEQAQDADGPHAFDLYLCSEYMRVEQGNYDGNSMFQYLQQELRAAAGRAMCAPLDATPILLGQLTAYGTLAKQFRVRFTLPNVGATLVFDMRKSTISDALGFSTHAADGSRRYDRLPHATNPLLYMSHAAPNPDPVDAVVTPLVQYLEPDGIMNLQGLRYILLRIPEIENHLLNSFAYGQHCPGVGMFKLASGNEIAYLRFDFVNLVKRPFHPIGKLPRITLRFELADGSLYNFKGVDYSLLMVIKYYSPKVAARPSRSLLNPNYDPDFVAYMNRAPRRLQDRAYDARDVLREQNKHDAAAAAEWEDDDDA